VRYAVQIGPHIILIDESHRQGDRVFQKGETVEVGVDPNYLTTLAE
jgi:hypothetical protein